jgi:TonB family protein
MRPGTARPATPADSPTFRAGLASFLCHAIIICLLIGGGLYYPKLLSIHESTPGPKAPPIEIILTETLPPPPPMMPVPIPLTSATASGTPGSAMKVVPAPTAIPAAQTKKAAHKQVGLAHHRIHKPPAAIPATPFVPIAKALPPKTPPRALPVLAPKPMVKGAPNKIPPHNLPIAPTVIAPPGKTRADREALSPKPTPPQIPTLPAMPPPRALPAEIAPPVIPSLPAMPPPRAQAVAIPAPVAIPVPVVLPPALPAPPAPEVVTEAVPSPAPAPASPPVPEAVEPPPPLASPDLELVPGPDRTKFPHPPYPYAARNLGLSGTVLMSVRFDEKGGVVSAEIAQSSGASILDDATKSFILSNWHLPDYAGHSVLIPIVYKLNPQGGMR